MQPLFTMWSNTRMVVLMALSAALYAAILIPFKFATIIPGLTEIRPGACVPIVTGILFGPAACWGSGLGNLIGDIAGGMFGPGSIFGFIANFALAAVSWKLWEAFRLEDKTPQERVVPYLVLSLAASSTAALIIGWGVDMLGIVPFAFLGVVVFLNEIVVAIALGPLLLGVLLPRATRWGLRYRSIMDVRPDPLPRFPPPLRGAHSMTLAVVLVVAAVAGLAIMLGVSLGVLHVGMLDPRGLTKSAFVTYGSLPFLLTIVICLALL